MAQSQYTQVNYFDFSSTATCGGSPIVLTSVGTGCSASVVDNPSIVCSAFNNPGEYKLTSTSCINGTIDFSGFARNYVVKSMYTTSEQCGGSPLQILAVAADYACHQNPLTPVNPTNSSASYMRVNCNGNQPIWEDCSDSSCTICQTTRYTSNPCQMAGAATSNKVQCVVGGLVKTPTTSVTPTVTALGSSPTNNVENPFNTSDSSRVVSPIAFLALVYVLINLLLSYLA